MKKMAAKSLVVAIISVFILSSCVEEMLYITEEEKVEILNNLAYSTGEIKTGTENALIPELTLEQDTILVDEFSELSLESSSSEDFQFSDSQKASLKVSAEGGYTVKTLTYKEYIVEDYSPNKRKITVLFDMDYEYLGELRSVVLSPWYFQETPVKVTPQDPKPVDKVTFNPYQTIKDNGKGTITATFFVDKIVNEQVDTTYKAVVTIAKVGSVSGMEVHTVSTSCTKEDMTCESLSTSEKVVKDLGDKLTDDDKSNISEPLAKLKDAVAARNVDEITLARTALDNVWGPIMTRIYQSTQTQNAGQGINNNPFADSNIFNAKNNPFGNDNK